MQEVTDAESGKLIEVKPTSPVKDENGRGDTDEQNPSLVATLHSPNFSKENGSSSTVKAISACLLYSFCSVSMVLVNKSLASRLVMIM